MTNIRTAQPAHPGSISIEDKPITSILPKDGFDQGLDLDSDQAITLINTMHDVSLSRWTKDNTGTVFWGAGTTSDTLPPGLFRIDENDKMGVFLAKQIVSVDDLLLLPQSDSEDIVNEIQSFWDLEDQFRQRGLLHKRGILMRGDPGSGKTSTIQLIIKKMIDDGGIVLYPSPYPKVTSAGLQLVRRIEPTRPIILIMEDFETLVAEPRYENEWLSILDGENQIDGIVFLATTNYIEKLDKRFTDRPSRFDQIKLVGMPNRESRAIYLRAKEPSLTGRELEKWLDCSQDLSIAHLKEMVISVKILGNTLESTIERMNSMRKRKYSSNDQHKRNMVGLDDSDE